MLPSVIASGGGFPTGSLLIWEQYRNIGRVPRGATGFSLRNRVVGYTLQVMRDFVDTKAFGATCTGVAAAATCYVAGFSDWLLIASPMAVVSAYYLFFSASELPKREFLRWRAPTVPDKGAEHPPQRHLRGVVLAGD